MKHPFVVVIAICVCALLAFVSTTQSMAQTTAQYRGTIKVLDKDAKTISIQVKTAVIQVKYTDRTAFTYRNKPGSIDDIIEGRQVIVVVDPQKDPATGLMVALRVDLREKK